MLSNRLCETIVRTSWRHLGTGTSTSKRSFVALHCCKKNYPRKTVLPGPGAGFSVARYQKYSTESNSSDYHPLQPLTDDYLVTYPNIFKTIKGFFQIFTIIKPSLDSDFSMYEFLEGSKQALCTVSQALARENYESLQGLVTQDVINKLTNKISTLSYEHKQLISIEPDDIYGMFPYEIGIMFEDDKPDQKFVEIMVIYYALKGLAKARSGDNQFSPHLAMNTNLRKQATVCNYRFVREFTKGVESSWTINSINHFSPDAL